VSRIKRLAANPLQAANVKRLVNYDVSYRLSVGNYRVLFERDDAIRVIDVIDILPRGRAYRR
jgi:mRNA interferase RelE/StbE